MKGGQVREFARLARDRLPYIALYAACAAALILVAALDRGGLRSDNLAYVAVLAAFFLLTALGVDYARQAAYARALRRIGREPDGSLDRVLSLPEPATGEQRLVRDALLALHRTYTDQLTTYRAAEERRHLFLTQWVHQMKTPVSVIELLAQQADRETDAGELQREMRSVREENERIAEGLELILHQARLEKFEMDVVLTRVDLAEVMRSVINSHKNAFIRASLFPTVEGGPAWVETDRKWLAFVLGQIVSNAIKYSRIKPGAKRIRADIVRTGDETAVRIADEGIGIAAHELPRIFDPYYTGDNGRRTGESTGMGLYLAREVCRRLGHRLDVSSEPGAGTTVTVSFAGQGIHRVFPAAGETEPQA